MENPWKSHGPGSVPRCLSRPGSERPRSLPGHLSNLGKVASVVQDVQALGRASQLIHLK